jgi:pyruvate kinase
MIERAVAVGVDAIAISFVRSSDDMVQARAVAGPGVLLVAKIETALAVTRLDGIIDASDAVMVARGDLGTECPLEDVPHLQKRIVRACRASGRPVITATQMLESMTHALVPTRAEACDVANAVLDGTDALMLSGETAIGCDPVNAVRTMARLALRAESEVDPERGDVVSGKAGVGLPVGSDRLTSAMAHAAWRAALDANASAILCCTWSGATVRALARYRPAARLVALSPQEPVLRQLAMSWGAAACHLPACTTTDEMVTRAIDVARGAGYVRVGDVAVVLAGSPHDDAMAATDVLRLLCVT